MKYDFESMIDRRGMDAMAIEEGATIVRVGTAIYGARDYSKK